MQVKHYLYEIRALLLKDWLNVDDRHILRWMDLQRAMWLKNEFNANRIMDDKLSQSINVKMNLVNRSEIDGIKSNSVILKSDKLIPTTIIQHYRDSIIAIRNADILGENYNYVYKQDAIYSGSGKTNSRDIFAFIYNRYLYIKCQKDNPKIRLINNIVVEGVFENPVDVYMQYIFKDYYMDFQDVEYPVSEALWNYMKEQIINNGLIASQNEQQETQE
jgi:hypothetical protein